MDKKAKALILFFGAYLLVFWIGFKSGTIYLRMQNKLQVEMIDIARPPSSPLTYYIVEKRDFGSYSNVIFQEVGEDDIIMKMFMNEKTRPLLKYRDIKIYNRTTGEQLY